MPAALQNSAAPRFMGEFRHKVEGRNRITIPSGWRFVEEEVELFMTPKARKSCITVMMEPELNRLMAEAEKFPAEERSDVLEVLGSSLMKVTMDKAGRISIPDEYFDRLALPERKEVWLTGAMHTFNIWSIPDFETSKTENKSRTEELKRKLGI